MKKHTFNIKDKEQLKGLFARLDAMEMPPNGWAVTLSEFSNNRSLAQNRLLWRRVYQPIAEQISEATDTLVKKQHIHEFLREKFGTRVIVRVMGEVHSYPKSTTQYTKKEMTEYMEKCFAWGAEHGVFFDD
jgi:hypothetical protein